jgi:hypothetical protein
MPCSISKLLPCLLWMISTGAMAQSINHYVPHRTANGTLISGGITPDAVIPDPTYPPPGGQHAVGDTYTIGSCNLRTDQTWVYQWQLVANPVGAGATGQWVLVRYTKVNVQSCEHSTA